VSSAAATGEHSPRFGAGTTGRTGSDRSDSATYTIQLARPEYEESIETIFTGVDREMRRVFDESSWSREKMGIARHFELTKTHDLFIFWFAHVFNEIQNGEASACARSGPNWAR